MTVRYLPPFTFRDCVRIYFVSFNFLSLENPSKYWWPFCFKHLRKTSTADALLEKLIVKWNVKLWKINGNWQWSTKLNAGFEKHFYSFLLLFISFIKCNSLFLRVRLSYSLSCVLKKSSSSYSKHSRTCLFCVKTIHALPKLWSTNRQAAALRILLSSKALSNSCPVYAQKENSH